MEMKNTVTVAIPVYNGSRFITKTLESIVNQTVKVDQILVSDNCSTDNTVQFVKEFAKSHKDFNIKVNENESNLGYQRNYNKCMELADTDYLLLLSSDDLLKPFTIEKQMLFLDNHPDVALVGGLADFIDEEGIITKKVEPKETLIFQKGQIMEFILKTSAWINPATVLLKLKYVREIGYWDEDTLGPDEQYWPKVLLKYPLAIQGESMLDFRRHHLQNGVVDSAKKYDEFVGYLKANIKIAQLENDPIRRQKTKKFLEKWAASRCRDVGRVAWISYKRPWTGIKYWWFGFRQYQKGYLTKSFLRSVFLSVKSLKDF